VVSQDDYWGAGDGDTFTGYTFVAFQGIFGGVAAAKDPHLMNTIAKNIR